MKILVTGANGFIGKNIFLYLKDMYEVKNPTREELNLINTEGVEEYLKKHNFDIIIHSANVNNVKSKETTSYNVLDGNLRMFYNLQRCQNYYGKMYYFGSGAEYDMQNYIPNMKEEYFDTFVPIDNYGFSKYIMSKSCKYLDNIYDLRLFGVFGKYEEWERRFISNAICRVLKGMDILIHKNIFIDYLWIDDLCNIIKWFVQNNPQYHHYNVCTGNKIDLYSLACIVKRVLKSNCKIIVLEEGLKKEYSGDNSKLLNEIGKYKFVDYEWAILNLAEFYKKHIDDIDENKFM